MNKDQILLEILKTQALILTTLKGTLPDFKANKKEELTSRADQTIALIDELQQTKLEETDFNTDLIK